MYFESISWVKKLKESYFAEYYQCLNLNASYFWQSTRMTVLCNILEALCLRRADTVISASSCPSPLIHTQCHYRGCKGCSLFDCGANARTDSTLILILVWWILRNIISHSSLAVSRFWEEVNVSPILSQGGPGLCLCELQQLEADRKQQNCWVQWLQELGSIGGIEKPVKFREIGNSVTCLNLKNHRIREW